ncbi:hypothetical protein AFUB_073250 [Aspergillus fumigatus A1163]|uniref:Uncharacterized protein n=1 Tax=Aspergillus fumigatus (strain CBS 144.89 / FGSC A1163 / CEA10) TaxID=451804 RepID=B0Y7B7_ASPFC|nr:hypothetical protein AFUB_073250 [Aspergillus fumigatus A1163]
MCGRRSSLLFYSNWLDHHSAQTTSTAPTSCVRFFSPFPEVIVKLSQSRLLSASPPARFSIPAFLSGRIHPPPILLSLDPSTVHNPVHSPQSTAPDLISTGLPVLPVSFKQRLILIFIFSITLS